MREASSAEIPVVLPEEKKSKKIKVLALAAFGNCMELYDYSLYAVMLPFVAPVFFPAESGDFSMVMGYLSFAISLLFCPLGSIFWGWFGDNFGRFRLMMFTMIIMAVASTVVALLPGYNELGLFAPLLLISARILQSFSASGEVKGAKIFAMEYLGPKHYGTVSGILNASGAVGLLLAMFMAHLTFASGNPNFWRIPFALGGILYVISAMMRKSLNRDIEAQKVEKSKIAPISVIFKVLFSNLSASKVVFLLGGLLGAISYMMHAFLPPYVKSLGYAADSLYIYSIFAYIFTVIASITVGVYFNGKEIKKAILYSILSVAIVTPVTFFMLQFKWKILAIIAYSLLGINLGAYCCLSSVIMYQVFPNNVRCRGVLFNYALGVGIFGGFTPLLMNFLAKINTMLPGVVISILAMSIVMLFRKDLKHANMYQR